MAEFHEVLFPPQISYGSSGGPRFKTTIFTADSGHEQRNIDWSQVRGEWDVAHAMRDLVGDEQLVSIEELNAFFMARNGRMHGFRFRDPGDCTLKNERIGTGDGSTRTFAVTKTYKSFQPDSGSYNTYVRKVRKIEWDSIPLMKVGGIDVSAFNYEVDHDNATITFLAAPDDGASIVIPRGVFHIPVRFDTDHCDVSADFWNTASWPSIPIIEIRT